MIDYKMTYCSKCGGNCWNCFYADMCNNWNDVAPYNPAEYVPDEISVVLCESRHDVPQAINGAIYPSHVDNPMNFGALYEMARDMLNPCFVAGVKTVNVYVTGLTPALLCVVNYCRECGVELNTWHYDINCNQYKLLKMVS